MIDYDFKEAKETLESFKNLYEIVTLLRSPEGCPWDRKQKPQDMIHSLMDECYEYVDALTEKNIIEQKEELGDIFLNLFMLMRINEEENNFLPAEVLNIVCKKLIRRHPHVFTSNYNDVKDPEEVLKLWNKVKTDVEGRTTEQNDIFSHIPKSSTQLSQAYEITKKAAKKNFDWENVDGVYDKIEEELNEVKAADTKEEIEEEIGDVLFAVTNLARKYKVDPDIALHKANEKFKKRFNIVLNKVQNTECGIDKLEQFWNEAKEELKNKKVSQ